MVQRLTEFDTIAAISTPLGEGGISIVRVSGEDAVAIVNRLFKGKDLEKVPSHTINYGHIVDPATGQVIDEVMASVMLAPKTFTKEDIVEINCHGGIVVTNDILQLLLANGARMADPGEFTKRAFVNGRIDLTQAESVMDIIRAKTDKARQVAVKQLSGGLLTEIRALRQEILDVLAKYLAQILHVVVASSQNNIIGTVKEYCDQMFEKLSEKCGILFLRSIRGDQVKPGVHQILGSICGDKVNPGVHQIGKVMKLGWQYNGIKGLEGVLEITDQVSNSQEDTYLDKDDNKVNNTGSKDNSPQYYIWDNTNGKFSNTPINEIGITLNQNYNYAGTTFIQGGSIYPIGKPTGDNKAQFDICLHNTEGNNIVIFRKKEH